MATPKSPFYVLEDFLSPKICEKMVDLLEFYTPDFDAEGNPMKMFRYKEDAEMILFQELQKYIPRIMKHYGTNYKGTETIQFEYFPQGVEPTPICENSDYLNRKWVRTKGRDLSGVLFLYDYNDNPPFDDEFECYGGKLEFPQHGFSFNPQRGTLVIYPSVPHFINATSMVEYGETIQARIHMATMMPFLYNPQEFPGDYRTWF